VSAQYTSVKNTGFDSFNNRLVMYDNMLLPRFLKSKYQAKGKLTF